MLAVLLIYGNLASALDRYLIARLEPQKLGLGGFIEGRVRIRAGMCDDIFFERALDQSANVVHRGRVMPSELLKNLMEQAPV